MTSATRRSISRTQELSPVQVARLADIMAMSDLELAIYAAAADAAIPEADHAALFSTEAS